MTTRSRLSISKPKIRSDGTIPWPPPTCSATSLIPHEPTCFSEASKHLEWRQAMSAEYNALLATRTWTIVPPSTSSNVLGVKWVFKTKRHSNGTIECRKACLVAKGFHQQLGVDFTETFCPVAKRTTIRLLLSLAAVRGWLARQLDIQNAFLHGDLSEDVYIQQPPDQFIAALGAKFLMKDLGPIHYFLGIEVRRDSDGFHLSQSQYIRDICAKANMQSSKPVATPMSTAIIPPQSAPFNDPHFYLSIVGSLQYLAFTRPDISFAVNKVCQFMQAPQVHHWQAVKRIVRYLNSTVDLQFLISAGSGTVLSSYSDADWGGNQVDRRSTSAYCILLGSNLVSWSSRKQPTVSKSSTEAEYRSLATATCELLWVQSLQSELGIRLPTAPILWCDNLGATYLAMNLVLHHRIKHLSLDYHFVRKRVQAKTLQVAFVSLKEQLADLLTKPLASTRFLMLRSQLCLHHARIEGA